VLTNEIQPQSISSGFALPIHPNSESNGDPRRVMYCEHGMVIRWSRDVTTVETGGKKKRGK
jgi:hypothetical protein